LRSRETGLMDQLATALSKLDWPRDRLEILLLLEPDDIETQRAAADASFPSGSQILLVPPGGPRTKPNALNYGLRHASGDYLVIYDVEDLPAPDQLQRAHALFCKSGPDTVCLQAQLVADNAKQSWLAAQWALEYDAQFGLLLPAIALCRLPVLLGGTSNHFRTEALRRLGGWDAWNVTEDADLGMRIARTGRRVRRLRSITYEDAPTSLSIWLPQRSRWLKGYLQTWLVLMRRPRETMRDLGLGKFIAVQASLGGAILAPLFHLPLALVVIGVMCSDVLDLGRLGLSLLIGGYAVSLFGDLCAPGRWSLSRLFAMLTKPFYWPLLSIAAYRAIWALAKRPYFWAKTPHEPRTLEPSLCSTGSSAQPLP
ncbi:MAG: glycosyltransferase family 2 protein, partial [Pseudomonadota bacterium]